jgi:mediator of replication checkpoint protein 1
VSSPEIYRRPSPSQKAELYRPLGFIFPVSQSQQRQPLRTLSLLEDFETPDYASRGRLRRRNSSPLSLAEDISYRSSPLSHASDKKPNAFDVLTRNARSQVKVHKPRAKLGESEFVEAEAQESDDDEMRGFGILTKKDEDEDEDGEDLDKNLEGLVDDAEMDDETQAKEKVLEKVKSVGFYEFSLHFRS